MQRSILLGLVLGLVGEASANPPVASYLYPAGGQRGTTVPIHVGGLYLGQRCEFHLDGPGVVTSPQVKSTPTLWFEGPQLPLPESQRQEDYPRDMAGSVQIAADAPPGLRKGRVSTAEGVAAGLTFVVGELPEITEQEIAGEPIPVAVKYPLTINGRIFPRQDRDLWTVDLKGGTTLTVAVDALSFGSPLDACLEILDPQGRLIFEKESDGRDPQIRFTATVAGVHTIRISDSQLWGSQAHVYRLTVTDGLWVDTAFPLGGRSGHPLKLQATGQRLPPAGGEVTLPEGDGPIEMPLVSGGNRVTLDRDVLPEVLPGAGRLTVPVVVNGRIDRPGQIQTWPLRLGKGRGLAFEVRANRLGSRLQAVLVLKDAQGTVVSRAESKPGAVDPTLAFTPPVDGDYTLEVSDRFAGRGGDSFGYRVRIAPPEPRLQLRLASEAVNVVRGATAKVRVTVDGPPGVAESLNLSVEGLPQGVTAMVGKFPRNGNTTDLTLTASETAKIGPWLVQVRATSEKFSQSVQLLLGVAVPVPFKVVADYEMRWSSRGSTHRRKYRVERNGYTGPLTIRLADRQARHLQGVTGPTITLAPDQDRFEYAVQLAPDMEIGRTCRVCIMASGVLSVDGQEVEVHYSKAEQNDQIITVVETGRLGIETPLPAVVARPDTTVEVPFTLSRAPEINGAIRVELVVPDHVQGVKAETVLLPAGEQRGTLKVRFAAERIGPFNLPVILRATHGRPGDTTRGEARLEVLSEGTP